MIDFVVIDISSFLEFFYKVFYKVKIFVYI